MQVVMKQIDQEANYREFVDRIVLKAFGLPVGLVIATTVPNVVKTILLFYTDAKKNSDKQYSVSIVTEDAVAKTYHVDYAFGKRGGPQKTGRKTTVALKLDLCERIFRNIVDEKLKGGYTTNVSGKA